MTPSLPCPHLLPALGFGPLDDLPLLVVEIRVVRVVRVILVDLVEALAGVVHAVLRVRAVAAGAELGVGGVDTWSQDGTVDKGEVGRKHSAVVDFVDDGDGKGLVGLECAELAPVAALSLVVRDLDSMKKETLS